MYCSLQLLRYKQMVNNTFVDVDIICFHALPTHNDPMHELSSLFERLKIQVRESPHIDYIMETPFDSNGYLFNIATNNQTEPWTNPHLTGRIKVTASSLNEHGYEAIEGVVGHPHPIKKADSSARGKFHTRSVGDNTPWITIDLLKNPPICPSAYCIGATSGGGCFALRNWKFQASVDGKKWFDLRVHENEKSEDCAFTVDAYHAYFRFFRIQGVGTQESGTTCMFGIGGFEIYGQVRKFASSSIPVGIVAKKKKNKEKKKTGFLSRLTQPVTNIYNRFKS